MPVKDFRQLIDLSYKNTADIDKDLEISFVRPDVLKSNLDSKQCRVVKFAVNNTYIPVFIPTPVTHASKFDNFFTVDPHPTGTNTNYNPYLSFNSMDYYIILRRHDTGDTQTFYLYHHPENANIPTPYAVIDNEYEYESNEYYWYHSFQHFLNGIAKDINLHNSDIGMEFTINSKGITMYVKKTFMDKPATIEFSQSLLDVLPFRSNPSSLTTGGTTPSRELIFPSFVTSSGVETYKSISCVLYEKNFPFSQLLVISKDLGVNFTYFIDNAILTNNTQQNQPTNTILAYSLRTNLFLDIYDYYTYQNSNDSLWNNFYTDTSPDNRVSLSLKLRFKNGDIIPFKMKPNDLFSITVEVKTDLI